MMKSVSKRKHSSDIARRARLLERRGHRAKAMELNLRAAKLGHAGAQRRFARYGKGDELWTKGSHLEDRGEIKLAVKLYKKAAALGDTGAMLNLANLLDDKVSPSRPDQAVYWYKRGIRWGNYTAAFNLAMHYRNLGKSKWYIHWMRVAARMGDPDAKRFMKRHVRKR